MMAKSSSNHVSIVVDDDYIFYQCIFISVQATFHKNELMKNLVILLAVFVRLSQ